MVDDSKEAKGAIEKLMEFVSESKHLPKEIGRKIAKILKNYRLGQEGELSALIEWYLIDIFFEASVVDKEEAEDLASDDLLARNPKGEVESLIAYLNMFGKEEGWGRNQDEKIIDEGPSISVRNFLEKLQGFGDRS